MAGRRTGSAAECVRGPSFRHPGLGLGLGLGTDKESKHYNSLIRSDQIRSDRGFREYVAQFTGTSPQPPQETSCCASNNSLLLG